MTGYLSMAIYQLVDIDVLRRVRVPIDQSDPLTNGEQQKRGTFPLKDGALRSHTSSGRIGLKLTYITYPMLATRSPFQI
jgi:hypothetical protein